MTIKKVSIFNVFLYVWNILFQCPSYMFCIHHIFHSLDDINSFDDECLKTNTQTYAYNTPIRKSPETIKSKSYASIILCYLEFVVRSSYIINNISTCLYLSVIILCSGGLLRHDHITLYHLSLILSLSHADMSVDAITLMSPFGKLWYTYNVTTNAYTFFIIFWTLLFYRCFFLLLYGVL